MRHIAAEIKGKRLSFFIEGVTLTTCLRSLKSETIEVQMLVFVNENYSVYHDMKYTDNSLVFCKQKITAATLLQCIRTIESGHPTELEFGNSHFHIQQWYSGAWMGTFYQFQKNDVYEKFIGRMLAPVVRRQFEAHLNRAHKAATGRLENMFKDISLEKLAQSRFDAWHDKIVRSYERSIEGPTGNRTL